MESDAIRDPAVVGLKMTLIVQLVPSASEVPQLLVCEKSPGFVPVMEIVVIVSVAFPVLLSVTAFGALLEPNT